MTVGPRAVKIVAPGDTIGVVVEGATDSTRIDGDRVE